MMTLHRIALGLILAFPLLIAGDLQNVFNQAPESAKPWVFWYWMNGNVTKEGITRDLENMAEVGIGGAMLFSIGKKTISRSDEPAVNALTDPWWELVVHAIKEADRLGLKIAMNSCDGWALAGGPWITPETSMQELVFSEKVVEGGKMFNGRIDKPEGKNNYYRDVKVLAYPLQGGPWQISTQLQPKATSNIGGLDPQVLVKGSPELLPLQSEGWIQFEFAEPFTCRSINIRPNVKTVYQLNRAELLVSDDGENFRSLGRLKPPAFHGWQDGDAHATHSIQPTRAKFFRFVIDFKDTPPPSENHEGAKGSNRYRPAAKHIELSSQPRIHHYQGKAGYRYRRSDWTDATQVPNELCVPLEKIVDLTDRLQADDSLKWMVPEGSWVIRRIGYTTTGETTNPPGSGVGLECDKFNPAAAKTQFDGWFGEVVRHVGPELAGKTLVRNHTDSWEAGCQNFSPVFIEEFRKRRGYDPILWLPAYDGVLIESAERTERFLFDVRQTISDLVSENFYQTLVGEGRKHGIGFSAECIAPTMLADGLQHFKYTDVPMGEFWINSARQDKPNDILDAVSGGRIYGKSIIAAEAFTQNPIRWDTHPFSLKALGDYNFAQGINQFALHVWAHQAYDMTPGMTLGRVGSFFGGTQTWHKPGKAWIDYLTRCSALLQQGVPVVDVCYFIGEELPSRSYLRHDLPLPLPEGYSYVCVNRDALLTLARAKDGRLVFPGGLSCSLLVIPPSERMSPELAEVIGRLAEAGVSVISSSPNRSISMSGYPECDRELRRIVGQSWGKVLGAGTPGSALASLAISPDLEFPGVDLTPVYREAEQYTSPPLVWTHRQTEEADIYFISNQEKVARTVEVAFRMQAPAAELWNPLNGEITRAEIVYKDAKGRVVLPIHFTPSGSVFVVFRRDSPVGDPVTNTIPQLVNETELPAGTWLENGMLWSMAAGTWELTSSSGQNRRVMVPHVPTDLPATGPWKLRFPPSKGAPDAIQLTQLKSLSEHENFGVRHFSGTATYASTLKVPEVSDKQRFFLDLGVVCNLAEVEVNGRQLGVLFKPPYLVEVTDVIHAGENPLVIKVTNTWKNRLIGDVALPENERVAKTWQQNSWFEAGDALEPAGLIGPVVLKVAVGRPY